MAVDGMWVAMIERSAETARLSVSVALLLLRLGSVVPAGAATEAVFARVPVAVGERLQTAVKVALAPGGRVPRMALMLPVPDGAGQAEPAQVQVTLVQAAG